MKNYKFLTLLIGLTFLVNSCEAYLEEDPASELAPDTFLSTKAGLQAIFYGAYDIFGYRYSDFSGMDIFAFTEFTGDSYYQTGGGYNNYALVLLNFQWDSETPQLQGYWNGSYQAIRDCNIIIDNIEAAQGLSDTEKTQFGLSSRLIRAEMYMRLYDWYGPVPLRISTLDEPALPRNTNEEVRSFIESEMEAIIPLLANPGEGIESFMDKGTAAGLYSRYLLNTKQWQKAADYCKEVIDLGYYELFPDYTALFDVPNDIGNSPNNKEILLARPATSENGFGHLLWNNFVPANNFDYSDKLPNLVKTTSMVHFGSQFRLRDAFTDSFDKEKDTRFSRIFENYRTTSGELVDLRSSVDNSRSFKYYDPNATRDHGNDIPNLRYADILLMRAEALNELSGPNQESIDLLNEVRNRAGLTNFLVTDFGNKTQLRDHIILNERRWEFHEENSRRRDLIRHGSFVSLAQARGAVAAQDFHVKFPIPQSEINGNPNMQQNTGY